MKVCIELCNVLTLVEKIYISTILCREMLPIYEVDITQPSPSTTSSTDFPRFPNFPGLKLMMKQQDAVALLELTRSYKFPNGSASTSKDVHFPTDSDVHNILAQAIARAQIQWHSLFRSWIDYSKQKSGQFEAST